MTIKSKPSSPEYREEFDRIFKPAKPPKKPPKKKSSMHCAGVPTVDTLAGIFALSFAFGGDLTELVDYLRMIGL